jgi:hypothetical protein
VEGLDLSHRVAAGHVAGEHLVQEGPERDLRGVDALPAAGSLGGLGEEFLLRQEAAEQRAELEQALAHQPGFPGCEQVGGPGFGPAEQGAREVR